MGKRLLSKASSCFADYRHSLNGVLNSMLIELPKLEGNIDIFQSLSSKICLINIIGLIENL